MRQDSACAYDISREGHRDSYLLIAEKLLGTNSLVGTKNLFSTFRFRQALFLTIDDYFMTFVVISLLRSLLGKKTVGISIRMEAIIEKMTPKRFIKRSLLQLLKPLPGVRVLALSPPWAVPGMESFTADWIDDLQLWDAPLIARTPPSLESNTFVDELERTKNGRKLILNLGRQDWQKGFKFFVSLAANKEIQARFQFAVVGRLREVDPDDVALFKAAGGIIDDRFLPESDLLDLYQKADLIWSCYDPVYNVNSGIFGRAVQFSKPTIVRRGSFLERFQKHYSSGIALDYGDVPKAQAALLGYDFAATAPVLKKPEGEARFRSAIGFTP